MRRPAAARERLPSSVNGSPGATSRSGPGSATGGPAGSASGQATARSSSAFPDEPDVIGVGQLVPVVAAEPLHGDDAVAARLQLHDELVGRETVRERARGDPARVEAC